MTTTPETTSAADHVAWIRPAQAAVLLQKSERHVRRMCAAGTIECRRDRSGHWVVSMAAVELLASDEQMSADVRTSVMPADRAHRLGGDDPTFDEFRLERFAMQSEIAQLRLHLSQAMAVERIKLDVTNHGPCDWLLRTALLSRQLAKRRRGTSRTSHDWMIMCLELVRVPCGLVGLVVSLALLSSCTREQGTPSLEIEKQVLLGTPREEYMIKDRALARCMKEQGFEYIPFAPAELLNTRPATFISPASLDEQTISGFGRSESIRNTRELRETGDPNLAIVSRLNLEDSRAYLRALNGNEQVDGCIASFDRSAAGEAQQRLLNGLSERRQRISFTSAAIEWRNQWSKCMSKMGYVGLVDFSDVYSKVLDVAHVRLAKSLGDTSANLEGPPVWGLALPNAELLKLSEQLWRVELPLAKADAACKRPFEKNWSSLWVAELNDWEDTQSADLDMFESEVSKLDSDS